MDPDELREARCEVPEYAWKLLPSFRVRGEPPRWHSRGERIQPWEWRFVVRNPNPYAVLFVVRFRLRSDRDIVLCAGVYGEPRFGDDMESGTLYLDDYARFHEPHVVLAGKTRVLSGSDQYSATRHKRNGTPWLMEWSYRSCRLHDRVADRDAEVVSKERSADGGAVNPTGTGAS
jgi:hypothetical protein